VIGLAGSDLATHQPQSRSIRTAARAGFFLFIKNFHSANSLAYVDSIPQHPQAETLTLANAARECNEGFFLYKNIPLCTLAGFDLMTHFSAGGDNTTRPGRQAASMQLGLCDEVYVGNEGYVMRAMYVMRGYVMRSTYVGNEGYVMRSM
jgi:hypothetical protein